MKRGRIWLKGGRGRDMETRDRELGRWNKRWRDKQSVRKINTVYEQVKRRQKDRVKQRRQIGENVGKRDSKWGSRWGNLIMTVVNITLTRPYILSTCSLTTRMLKQNKTTGQHFIMYLYIP